MTRWTQKATVDKTYANARTFFKVETASIESYKAANRKFSSNNDCVTVNAALKITELLKATKAKNEVLAKALERNIAEHICAMKELHAEMTQGKEEDK